MYFSDYILLMWPSKNLEVYRNSSFPLYQILAGEKLLKLKISQGMCAGVQPRLIQGIRRRDGFGDLFI